MNKKRILFHLSEARKALKELIRDLHSRSRLRLRHYRVDMEHLYHHINSAWNARDALEQATNQCAEEDFRRWRQFPTDMSLLS